MQRRPLLVPVILLTGLSAPRLLRPIQWFDAVNTIDTLQTTGLWELLYTTDAPLYYSGAKLWLVLSGVHPISLRTWSLIASIATLLLTYKIATHYYSPHAGQLAAGILALSNALHLPTTWIRPYAVLIFLGTLFWWLLITFDRPYSPTQMGWMVLVGTATVLIHQTGIVIVGTLLLLLFARKEFALSHWMAVPMFGLGVAWIFGPRIFATLFGSFNAVPHLANPPHPLAVLLIFPKFVGMGGSRPPQTQLVLGGVLLALVAMFAYRVKLQRLEQDSLFYLVIPVVGFAVFSYSVSPIFTHKYLLFLSVPAVLFLVGLSQHLDRFSQAALWGAVLSVQVTGVFGV